MAKQLVMVVVKQLFMAVVQQLSTLKQLFVAKLALSPMYNPPT
jgi:hypothetical protein